MSLSSLRFKKKLSRLRGFRRKIRGHQKLILYLFKSQQIQECSTNRKSVASVKPGPAGTLSRTGSSGIVSLCVVAFLQGQRICRDSSRARSRLSKLLALWLWPQATLSTPRGFDNPARDGRSDVCTAIIELLIVAMSCLTSMRRPRTRKERA